MGGSSIRGGADGPLRAYGRITPGSVQSSNRKDAVPLGGETASENVPNGELTGRELGSQLEARGLSQRLQGAYHLPGLWTKVASNAPLRRPRADFLQGTPVASGRAA